MGNGGMTPTLVTTLSTSKDENMKEVAAEKLCNKVRQYGDHPDYVKAVGSHAGKPLVEMLNSGTPKGKTHAAATLSFLVRNKDCKEEIVKLGAIPVCVKLGKEGTEGQQAAVAAFLANVASGNSANQAALAQAGAIQLLIDLLKSGRSEAKGWAASALGNLQNPTNQRLSAEAGAIEAIVEVLQGHKAYVPPQKGGLFSSCSCRKRAPPHGNTSMLAARAISSVAYNNESNQARIVEAGGVEALVKVIREGSPEDELEAQKALGFIWSGASPLPAVKAKLLDADAVRVLIEVVRNATDESKSQAANLIARLANDDPLAQSAIATCGGVPALVELANNSRNPACKIGAVKALRELSSNNPENDKLIEEAGGKPLLDRLLGSGMKFRELSEEDKDRMAQVQAMQERADALLKANAEE